MTHGNAFEFERSLDFDPAAPLEPWLKPAPARRAVYLMADGAGRPVQLLCVADLKTSLRSRLSAEPAAVPSRRVDYREVVRRVSWTRVDSALEADWVYHEAARQFFPETYAALLGARPAWFLHVEPDAEFPRWSKTTELIGRAGSLFGPVEDKHAAARLIESVEDVFDLCRYYHILVQAPNGKACAYKEMGKCPAPCDGSISIEQYRRMIEWSARTLADPQDFIREHERRMRQAAAELRFEVAGKIKALTEQLATWTKGPNRFVQPIEHFAYVTLQRGPRPGTAKVFLARPGDILELACLTDVPAKPAELLRTILAAAEQPRPPLDRLAIERIGLVTHHLFAPKRPEAAFIPLTEISEKAIVKSYREVVKQKAEPVPEVGEGVTRELGGCA